ncbi:hypothetical protein Daesc_003808 [Daldinia eschscholtzii]|uniref:C6 zinc finger domain-containing protein n=1 Tax=Daldinia eschscholtzii TaxID=292717 RepID=A0AAX6MMY7_9PEZI
MTCKEPPYIPATEEWTVHFQDESRLIASEYKGGLGRYANLDSQPPSPPRESNFSTISQLQPGAVESLDTQVKLESRSTTAVSPPHNYHGDRSQTNMHLVTGNHLYSRKSSEASFMGPPGPGRSAGYSNMIPDPFGSTKIENNRSPSHNGYRSDDVSTAASVAGYTGVRPPSTFRGGSGDSNVEPDADVGVLTPSSEKSGEREYLNSPEELRFMQVFVSEVGIWMDSLDKEKHFSRQIPYHALKCPMLLNALLACGVKHLTLTQQYSDDKALFYYDTATTQLLRSLQNPERDTAECATTAVVLNVYEIMSDKPTKRMSHIAGARALIRECGWNAKSKGLGAACFWLNVGMELLSCLAFNWQTAWEPEKWGLDMDFNTEKDTGNEEVWVHRIFYIVAKIANFRASIPKFQEPSPHDEQVRLQARYAEWQRLKNMCDDWNNSCPRPMHPFGLIKRAAIVGRLYYHTAQCLLAQINPILPKNSEEARGVQQHHAHQVCGIVAHTKDRGVASVSIRSLAIVAEILTDLAEQQEVVSILEKIDHETGWKLAGVIQGLKKSWGWEKMGQKGLVAQFLPRAGSGNKVTMGLEGHYRRMESIHANLTTNTTPSHHQMIPNVPQSGSQQLAAPRPMHVNPLSFADFSLPNHPYQNWYEPPSRSNAYSSQGLL